MTMIKRFGFLLLTIVLLLVLKPNTSSAIVGGSTTKENFFVHVYNKDSRCSGIAYQKNIIITSAHCIVDLNDRTWILYKNRVYFSKKIIIPNSYIHNPLLVTKDDIAFILLKKNIGEIEPIKIANLEMIYDIRTNAHAVKTYGVGRLCFDCSYEDVTRYIVSSVMYWYDNFIYYPARIDHGVCPGDSGGPTIYEKDGEKYLVSVTAGTNACQNNTTDSQLVYIGVMIYPYLNLLDDIIRI